jgi:hypothetical protein
MKAKFLIAALLLFSLMLCSRAAEAQAGKFIFQGAFGLVFPYDQLEGDDYVVYDSDGYVFIDSSLFANNFGAQPGMMFSGSAKVNFDNYAITRAVFSVAFSGFNSFQAKRSGTTLVRFVNNTYQPRPIEYDYSFSNVALGIGIEIAPTSFTKLISPFFNANFNFNFFTADLSRRSGYSDSIGVNLNSFRMGVNFNTGLEVMINNSIGVVAGVKYDLGNLLLKDTQRDGYIEWGSKDASLNDEYGRYVSNIYYPIGEGYNYFESNQKKLNWGTAYIGINFNPFDEKPAKKKPKSTPKMLYGCL